MIESDPLSTLALASKAVAALADSQASLTEKAAALRTAAFAVEQAQTAQAMATNIALIQQNIRDQNKGAGK